MMSKVLIFVAGTLAMGLTWLLVIVAVAELIFGFALEGYLLGIVTLACLAAATFPSWKLFFKPTRHPT
jgi:uncharacterized membrane protein YccF (DUF307 family)